MPPLGAGVGASLAGELKLNGVDEPWPGRPARRRDIAIDVRGAVPPEPIDGSPAPGKCALELTLVRVPLRGGDDDDGEIIGRGALELTDLCARDRRGHAIFQARIMCQANLGTPQAKTWSCEGYFFHSEGTAVGAARL